MREGGGGSAAARAPAPCGRSPARLRPLREGSPLPSPLASPGPLGHPPPPPRHIPPCLAPCRAPCGPAAPHRGETVISSSSAKSSPSCHSRMAATGQSQFDIASLEA